MMTDANERRVSGSETRRRVHVRAVRLDDGELQFLSRRAQEAGLTIGAYIRRTSLGDAGPRARRRPIIERELLARLLGHLGKVGSNLNQIAAAVNSGEEIDRDHLAQELANLAKLRGAVMDALGRE